jgi:hypothetical protein
MFCWKCGAEMDAGLASCPSCASPAVPPARQFGTPSRRIEDDPAMRMLLPVGRSGWAIAAGYFGLFSLLPVFAPFSLILGIVAFRDIKAHPEKLGKGRAIFGLVMGVLGTILLLWILVSILMRPPTYSVGG